MKYTIAAILLILAIGCQADLMKIFRRKRTMCSYKNYVDGCSVPAAGQVIAAFEDEFKPSCNEHDVCYFCVSTTSC